MALKLSNRGDIPPFIVMDVLRAANERAAAGEDILHLSLGQPATPAPDYVLEAVKSALDTEMIGYTDAMGIPELRQGIADHYMHLYKQKVDPARVMVTTGSSAGFLLSFLAAFNPGDRVALVAPGYPAYRNILVALDIEPVLIEVGPKERFQPTAELLAAQGKLDGVIIASPSNPAGTMLSEKAFKEIIDYCASQEIRLISDEIYHGISYGTQASTALKFTDDAFIINSFSKYFSMTGWRLGWMILPEDMLRAEECLAQNFFISPPTLSQIAGAAVFKCYDVLESYVAQYARNRDILLNELPGVGFDNLAPADGGFYIYADISKRTNDSQSFCARLLNETGIAATPGVDFDPFNGSHFMRFSFAGTEQTMLEAVKRLKSWR
ncbi:1-aminocyclopropane-1-carboxylate deaminase [Kiloniella litopenaei]|uniref:Aminotransferase n=1 Tax=Kiloniella litopenaei TaxID=1549748 RepID=A0A0M2RE90_9PROT|nr:aminotransferase class I/II-fold pyridoxal phosphate-dependent enzyme [Kiloniella litopenaei]KKJ78330.1 1-aminocyclopropane-1-carboxylate deaminase [Kiloniella litopenaei]